MKVIFIHGYDTNPLKRKYQIIRQRLADLGVDCVMPAMPGDLVPRRRDWVEVIKNEVAAANGPVVLAGHSLGTAAILLYLDQNAPGNIESVVLFSAVDVGREKNREKAGGNVADFYCPVDYGKIRKAAKRFVITSSKDDPVVEFFQSEDLRDKLGAELLPVDNMGHFKGEATGERDGAYFFLVIKSVLFHD